VTTLPVLTLEGLLIQIWRVSVRDFAVNALRRGDI
jgi:hypothetical protein